MSKELRPKKKLNLLPSRVWVWMMYQANKRGISIEEFAEGCDVPPGMLDEVVANPRYKAPWEMFGNVAFDAIRNEPYPVPCPDEPGLDKLDWLARPSLRSPWLTILAIYDSLPAQAKSALLDHVREMLIERERLRNRPDE